MKFKTVNNITGWVVCLIACTVYILTAEAGGSLWDCGEFVASCFKLQVPHPPGAPLFVMLGRIFIVLFGNNPMTAAKAVNIMSALASGFTILFLFWTITHFAKRLVQSSQKTELTTPQLLTAIGAGIVGALAYTFSDSFWYSAVEGEVYALSSFFTAIVFWAILKWEHVADEPGSDKWIVFIFFLMGLSIGVHLLNLLTIPAVVMVYYFRKKDSINYPGLRKYFLRCVIAGGSLAFVAALISANAEAGGENGFPVDATVAGLMVLATLIGIGLLYAAERINKAKKQVYGGAYIFFVTGCVITVAIQLGVIQYSIVAAGKFDIAFVNGLGLPFFSGFAAFFILVALAIRFGLRYATKKNFANLRLGLWSLTFMLIGYSTYVTTMIRSSADTSLDISNVDNPISLASYLNREQYGDFPLLYGQKFTAQPNYKETGDKYQKLNGKYVVTGKEGHYAFAPDDKTIFPRMWDITNDQGHADYYANFAGIGKAKDGSYERAPTFAENMKFYITYQNYYMYFRYFMWNFSGKQNDLEGMFNGQVRDGNWITGISFIDNLLYGKQELLPDSIKTNKAHNNLFMLPLILGLIGLIYHLKRNRQDALVNVLLFLITGVGIVFYINQPGFQPRERDYAYVGSFYAFAIWIGLGVIKIKDWYARFSNQRLAASLATITCVVAVPLLMMQQEWNDHDRSKKQLARDLAKDYLESCAPNAILFSTWDNDTYPLWYAQEVEGIRPDVRIIITSLLTADWYINQLRYKLNQSAPVDVVWSKEQIAGSRRDVALYKPQQQFPENRYYDLYDMMKNYIGSDDPSRIEPRGSNAYNTYPVKKVAIPVDANVVKNNGTVNDTDVVLPEMRFEISKNVLYKNDLAMLNIIAANQWKRPVYFTNTMASNLGFEQYLRKDGLTYRLVPISNNTGYNTKWMYDVVMNKFSHGNADLHNVYFDEENRKELNVIRRADVELATNLLDTNHLEEARKVLQKTDKMILQENMPYGMVSKNNDHNRISLMFLQACYRADEKELAKKVYDSVKTDLEQQLRYYSNLDEDKSQLLAYDRSTTIDLLNALTQMEKAYRPATTSMERDNKIIRKDSF